ncbi:MAG TPA: hypothetical protein VN682_16835 [Terriglobales bacterium]|nr:hypothetical protein [Terriglobales bacterium]
MAKDQTNQPGEMTIEEQLKRIELEERQQALESRKLQDEVARIQLEALKREAETRKTNKARGVADAQKAIEDRDALRARCNHHLGGQGAMGIVSGQGDEERPTTIGAQVFLDDTIRLKCNRCGDSCLSTDPDRAKWAKWVGLWKHSFTKTMMVVGGIKTTKVAQVA